MLEIEYLNKAIKKWWEYLIKNKSKIHIIVELLENSWNLTKEYKEIINYIKLILNNLSNIDKGRIYRWINRSYMKKINNKSLDNYVNSIWEASLYGENIVLEYEYDYSTPNVIEWEISNREDNVNTYDKVVANSNINWYRWYIGWWMYHYRIKNDIPKLKKIHYISDDLKYNISNLVEITRLYLWLSQKEFSLKLWLKQSKISEYENWKRELAMDMIIKIAWLIDIEQCVKSKNNILNISKWMH